MKKFIVVISFLSVLFFSCPEEGIDPIDAPDVIKQSFYVHNFKTSGVDSVETGLLADGKYCHIWVGRGANITKESAISIANTYDNNIYIKMMKYFSLHKEDEIVLEGKKLNNTLDIASLMVNYDGKLNIILVDITDNYDKGNNNAYTAGYFWNGDLFKRDTKNHPYSNECAAIFIDTYPAVPGSEESNSTLAHEMQHLMSYLNGFLSRDKDFDIWIDEGLSLSAEYLYLEKHISSRVSHYNNDPSKLICKGNNFFVWGNRKEESNYASLDDYATDYLFFQWLRMQTSNDIYYYIMFSSENNYQAVFEAYNDRASNKVNSWDTLLKTWLAANQINAATGPYGYKGQLNITTHTAPVPQTSISLYPGEGVYSKMPSSTLSPSGNIKYAYLSSSDVSESYTTNSTTLLTYNKNTNLSGSIETGTTTGIAASEQIVPDARFIASLRNEPIRIDARDMMGRDEWRNSYSNGVPGLGRGLNDE